MRFALLTKGADKPKGERVDASAVPAVAAALAAPERQTLQQPTFLDAKIRLHRRLIDELNLPQLERLTRQQIKDQCRELIVSYVLAEGVQLNARELEVFIEEIIDELTGLGPLEPLLKDPTISDILINSSETVYVERQGVLEPLPVRFKDEAHLLRVVNKIVSAVGRRVDESSPMIDARLQDGSRINVAIRPVAVDGPLVSIRKFTKKGFDLDRLVEIGSLSPAMAKLLAAAVRGRLSIMVSGGTGSGKTSLLNALSREISERERLITIEDAAELQLQQPHVGRLETRPANFEGRGEIRQRELLKNALRMRPDRILIGEVRGEEAFDMLNAMNTGHEGSLTTIHANSPRDAVARLEQMVALAGFSLSEATIRNYIASAIRLVVQLNRFPDGTRKITSVTEITGVESATIQMQELYKYVRVGESPEGRIEGEYRPTGIRPGFLDVLSRHGFDTHGAMGRA